MATVRVVIPTRNRAAMLSEALASVASQTYRDYEIVVTDDGSTDGTEALVRTVMARDSRVVYLRGRGAGPAGARNAALRYPGRFRYAAFLDDDDLWLPHHLADSVAVLERHPEIGVVFARPQIADLASRWSGARLRDRQARLERPLTCVQSQTAEGVYLLDLARVCQEFLRSRFCPHTSTVVLRRSAGDAVGWFDASLVLFEDCDLFLRLALGGDGFAYFDEAHERARDAGNNLTGVIDPTSPLAVRRAADALRYYRLKRRYCVATDDRRFVHGEIANAAYLVGQCEAARGELGRARRAYAESLRAAPSYHAFKGLVAALLPAPVYRRARALRAAAGG